MISWINTSEVNTPKRKKVRKISVNRKKGKIQKERKGIALLIKSFNHARQLIIAVVTQNLHLELVLLIESVPLAESENEDRESSVR